MKLSLMVVVLLAAGCGGAADLSDASTVSALDAAAGAPDGSSSSVGEDASEVGPADASTLADAGGLPEDASQAGPDASAAGPDAGASNACPAEFAGCTSYTDATASGASRTVTTSGFTYSPKCLKVAVGQTVTFSASFVTHPLAQSCGPASAIPDVASGSSKAVTFDVAGEYGYYCTHHGTASGTGMAGSILVQ